MHGIRTGSSGALRPLFTALVTIAAIAAASQNASSQVLYGSLIGNVTDPNGGVVPSAAVTATNQATGVVKTTATDSTGAYQFINLQPGDYTLKVTLAGFKTYERRDIPVTLNNITRSDAVLEVGSIEQSVTITGEAPELQNERAEKRAEVTQEEL